MRWDMKKIMFLIFVGSTASAGKSESCSPNNCQGKSVSCYDGCVNAYKAFFNVDTCLSAYDGGLNCYLAGASCSADAQDPCRGKTVSCYDACSNAYKAFFNVDTCHSAYDGSQNCYKAFG